MATFRINLVIASKETIRPEFVVLLTMYSRCFQDVRVQESSASCDIENKGLLRMRELHLEFCDGKSWVRLLDQKVALNSREKAGQQEFL